jgi:hypothetical protein
MSSATELPGDGSDLRQRHAVPDLKPDLPHKEAESQPAADADADAKPKKTFGRTPEGIGMSPTRPRAHTARPREMTVQCKCNP